MANTDFAGGPEGHFRFGSARLSGTTDLRRTGMFEQDETSLFIGFDGKRPVFFSGAGGVTLTAGARAGKLKDWLSYSLCFGIHPGTMLILDVKAELAAISANQTPDRKHCIYWNPRRLAGFIQHRINPLDYMNAQSPSLFGDVKVFAENTVPRSGSAQSEYFELRAREYLEAICLTAVQVYGELSYPLLYQIINLIPGNSDAWIDFAYEMSRSNIPLCQRVEQEIADSRDDSGGGFRGIMGELFKSIAALSDPDLMDSVSPPYDFSLKQLCESDQTYNLYLMPPPEMLEAWGPVVKSIMAAAMLYKSRAPSAPRQTWVIDEAAQLKKFPLLVALYSIGAGMGIRPVGVFQSKFQMKALGPDADNIITASAALQCYFGVRDIETAMSVSKMSGVQTLNYIDPEQGQRAEHARRQIAHAILNDNDAALAAMNYRRERQASQTPRKQHRAVMTPDEVINLSGKAVIFTDDLPGPALLDRRAYFDQRFMAGRYHPSPYYPPVDRVRVKSLFGYATKRVITESVPSTFANYPQYEHGTWSRIED